MTNNIYELRPIDGRKSFYGKCFVEVTPKRNEILYSYGTKILTRKPDGTIKRHWDGWSASTGRHVKAFCGMNKKEYEALPVVSR